MHAVLPFLAGTWQNVAGVSVGALVVGLVFHTAKLAAEARSWHWIVRHAHRDADVGFRTTLGAFVGSIGANAVLPARVGEALRIGVVRRRVARSSVLTIAATVVLETAVEAAFGIAVIAAVLLEGRAVLPGGASWAPGAVLGPVAVGAVAVLGLAAVAFAILRRAAARRLWARMAAGFSVVRTPRAFVTGVLSWKLVAWTLRLASVYAFLVAFHVPAAIWTVLLVVAAQNVAGALPLLPGSAGTQQAAIGVALAGTASTPSLLAFGVGMQAATAVTDLVLGALAVGAVATRADVRGALAAIHVPRRPRLAGVRP